jgi:hypothetical protein
MQLVFTRSEIYGPEILRRDLAVSGHGEGGIDKWALAVATHEKENAQRSTPNVQYLIF